MNLKSFIILIRNKKCNKASEVEEEVEEEELIINSKHKKKAWDKSHFAKMALRANF